MMPIFGSYIGLNLPDALWVEVKHEAQRTSSELFLDKLYAKLMDLVHHMGSEKHHAVVKSINLLTLFWTDGDRHLPCDYRIYDKPTDGKSKNNHFGDLIEEAKKPGSIDIF